MARPTSSKQVVRLTLYAIVITTIIGLIFWSEPSSFLSEAGSGELPDTSRPIQAIRNETLGVENIFAISLLTRADKRDNLILGASVSGFHIEIIDATTPDEINPKTYPYNWNHDHRPVEYAARRSHLNVMQRILRDRLASAIIMEDDADWDVTIKTQLQSFAIAVRALQKADDATTTTATSSPYGNDWDILWLGHCGISCRPNSPYYLTTPTDPTLPKPDHFLPYWRDPPPNERSNSSRMTCPINDGVCSIVYAVSFRGAQRILAALSVNPSGIAEQIDIGAQFDVSLGRMCGSEYLRCFAPYPALTGGYKSAGAAAKGSDINGPDDDGDGGEEEPFEGPFSHGVMYSTMLNINRILAGEKSVLSTWDDVPAKEIYPGDVRVLGGSIQVPKN